MDVRRVGPKLLLAVAACLAGCAAPGPGATPTAPPGLPTDLDPQRPVVIVTDAGGLPSIDDVGAPRVVTLYGDGALIASLDVLPIRLATVGTRLDGATLGRAWATVVGGGLAVDRSLALEGLYDASTVTFRVDDGRSVTTLAIYALGVGPLAEMTSFPPDEAALRINAEAALGHLRGLAGTERWTPPALLLWIARYDEAESGLPAKVYAWTAPVDLATAGAPATGSPFYERCVLVEGEAAAAVAAQLAVMARDQIAEQGGEHYQLGVRPVYPDEAGTVTCPGT